MTHSPADHPALKKPIRLAGRGVFLDCEVSIRTREIIDFGAADTLGRTLHSSDPEAIRAFLRGADYFCGHNAVRHDIGCLMPLLAGDPAGLPPVVDTLALSVLLFPQRRFHALMKDEKLVAAEENNPLTDALKARDLCFEALAAFNELSEPMQQLLSALLSDNPLYQGFFRQTGLAAGEPDRSGIAEAARTLFAGEICERADVAAMARKTPAELGLTLAFIGAKEKADCLPAWVLRNFPRTQRILDKLRDVPCSPRCPRCRRAFDAASGLKRFFGFEAFRTFDGKPLQQMAAQAALEGESLLAVFPTGGGKSITFQVPALMQARSSGALTVVISPLQSLMKDQVDHLIEAGVEGACTVNGLLSPLERARAMEMVASGHASILYLSPEQLRSRTIEKLLSERRIARFVIDEAHCFSAWGHDFRVDYLYIADFIALLEKHQPDRGAIPVSCFTATAKQKVIADISEYFEKRLGLRLRLFATDAARRNLHYKVLHAEDQNAKYDMVRELLKTHACPSIVYVSRTKSAEEIAKRLTRDGIRTLPYHGQMESIDKTDVQDAFLAGQVRVIVATNAFGMGVDKKDVGLVIHYDISSSLENYVQEAGRAGRDPSLEAECYVLFNEDDLDKHFSLLMQSKLSQADIQQVWRAVKTLARGEEPIEVSALELAREAGWDTDSKDFETRMRTAIAALETAGYITRGRNAARVFASGLAAESFSQARALIVRNPLFADPDVCMRTLRIVQSLVSRRSTQDTTNREGESRTDYLSDRLGIPMPDVVDSITRLSAAGILTRSADMLAVFERGTNLRKLQRALDASLALESFVLGVMRGESELFDINLKDINGRAQAAGCASASVKRIASVLRNLKRTGIIGKLQHTPHTAYVRIQRGEQFAEHQASYSRKLELSRLIAEKLFGDALRQSEMGLLAAGISPLGNAAPEHPEHEKPLTAAFSTAGILEAARRRGMAGDQGDMPAVREIENTLLWLSDMGVMRLQGGFMVIYHGMTIQRKVMDNKRRYRADDYRMLDEYYKQKLQQIHIVGEYANLMMSDYSAALAYVHDYFTMDYEKFIRKYFGEDRREELRRSMTAKQYQKLFAGLSDRQLEIIGSRARRIAVAAGPGSGKTMVLVHKLAALLLMEDVRPEHLLMLTFSRAAASEFRKRLFALIGAKAGFVDIKTFHSYAFDALGRLGSLEDSGDILGQAVEAIAGNTAVSGKAAKSTLVIDEAQDMSPGEYALVEALIAHNEEMRIIAVGDDDQNIYAFRGSDSRHLRMLAAEPGAVTFEMCENWRSARAIVALATRWVETLCGRMKHFPGAAQRDEEGQVTVTFCSKPGWLTSAAESLAAAAAEGRIEGSTALLAVSNEEALQAACLLSRRGIETRIVEGQQGVRLADLVEIRGLLSFIERRLGGSPIVSDELWKGAEAYLEKAFGDSIWQPGVKRLMKAFLALNGSRPAYFSDFFDFVRESRMEDLPQESGGKGLVVTVSTIHKAKGREFDNVWLLVKNKDSALDNEKRRLIYVGMTRAKNVLHIFTDVPAIAAAAQSAAREGVKTVRNDEASPPPEEIMLSLQHEDVVLDCFRNRKQQIFKMHCGQKLAFFPGGMTAEADGRRETAAVYSRKFKEEKLGKWLAQGYEPAEAHVQYIAAWKSTDDGETHAVLLPRMVLRKRQEPQASQ